MSKRIEVDILGFGKRYCSDNVKYKISQLGFGKRYCSDNVRYVVYGNYFNFYYYDKYDYEIWHNEYGPAWENKNGSYRYYINGNRHRLDGPAYYNAKINEKKFYINDKFIGNTEEEFIEYKNRYLLLE